MYFCLFIFYLSSIPPHPPYEGRLLFSLPQICPAASLPPPPGPFAAVKTFNADHCVTRISNRAAPAVRPVCGSLGSFVAVPMATFAVQWKQDLYSTVAGPIVVRSKVQAEEDEEEKPRRLAAFGSQSRSPSIPSRPAAKRPRCDIQPMGWALALRCARWDPESSAPAPACLSVSGSQSPDAG